MALNTATETRNLQAPALSRFLYLPLARTVGRVPLTRSFIPPEMPAPGVCIPWSFFIQVCPQHADRAMTDDLKPPLPQPLPSPCKASGGLFPVPERSFFLAIPVAGEV